MRDKKKTLRGKNKIGEMKCRIQFARASRVPQTQCQGGTWALAAENIARAEQSSRLTTMPPSFCSLNDKVCLRKISEMYSFLEEARWATCVVCWRAWYNVPCDGNFQSAACPGPASRAAGAPWFNCKASVTQRRKERKQVNHWVLEFDPQQGAAAERFLMANYLASDAARILSRLQDSERRRVACVCKSCEPHLEGDAFKPCVEVRLCDYAVDPVAQFTDHTLDSGEEAMVWQERWQDRDRGLGCATEGQSLAPVSDSVLGFCIHEFADPVAALTDTEEMVLALVHPLVQVYTIPKTGQLAYVGHVCNFRQKVASFLSSLPVLPEDMPFVMVRPRLFKNQRGPKAPFKINVDKVRKAYAWLKKHNPYYRNVEWIDSAEAAWRCDDVRVGVVREEDFDLERGVQITVETFARWLERGRVNNDAGDGGFTVAARAVAFFSDGGFTEAAASSDQPAPGSASACPPSPPDFGDAWNVIRAMAACTFDSQFYRMATSLDLARFAVLLHTEGVLSLGFPAAFTVNDMTIAVRSLPIDEWTEDLHMLCSELHVIQAELKIDEPTETAGGITEQPPDDDVGLRQGALDSLAKEVANVFDGSPAEARCKYPRVAPPEVEDDVGQAVREDTPGYIAMAFPKLFPHGTGDFHDLRQRFPKLLSFEEWGRFVMMWHDRRFMTHTRFRYWLLDTSLRMLTPTMKRTFFKTREAATQYTLADLENKDSRRNLVQQMSSATSKLPGSVGERRKMRQELEAMVHQIETETADNGENGGAGRIPAGFSTLTCAVYKWEQLHTTILKSYPPGSASDPQAREYYQQWRNLPDGSSEKDTTMKKTYYELALHNPGTVAWYCSLKLEMMVHLAKEIITEMLQSSTVPGMQEGIAILEEELRQKVGIEVCVEDLPDLQQYGRVDDFYASLEWSAGGLVHVHIAYWIVGAPRIDKVVVPRQSEAGVFEVDVTAADAVVLPHERAANVMSTFWDGVICEFNVAKHEKEGGDSDKGTLRSATGVRST